ncbi:hypothetical protein ACC717_38410, partial [Rhizobium ruizarguesonis]
TSRLAEVAALYFAGGLFAWPLALPVSRFFAYGRQPEARFAAFFVTLTASTILMTAFLFDHLQAEADDPFVDRSAIL